MDHGFKGACIRGPHCWASRIVGRLSCSIYIRPTRRKCDTDTNDNATSMGMDHFSLGVAPSNQSRRLDKLIAQSRVLSAESPRM